jgi:hypothetical protein
MSEPPEGRQKREGHDSSLRMHDPDSLKGWSGSASFMPPLSGLRGCSVAFRLSKAVAIYGLLRRAWATNFAIAQLAILKRTLSALP